MTKQPEALRLANLLDLGGDATRPNHWEAAEELRRLHEVNQKLLEVLKTLIDMDVAYQRGDKVAQAVESAQAVIAKAEVKHE